MFSDKLSCNCLIKHDKVRKNYIFFIRFVSFVLTTSVFNLRYGFVIMQSGNEQAVWVWSQQWLIELHDQMNFLVLFNMKENNAFAWIRKYAAVQIWPFYLFLLLQLQNIIVEYHLVQLGMRMGMYKLRWSQSRTEEVQNLQRNAIKNRQKNSHLQTFNYKRS